MDSKKIVYDFVTLKKFNDGTEKIYVKIGWANVTSCKGGRVNTFENKNNRAVDNCI